MKFITSTVFNLSRKRKHFSPSAAPKICVLDVHVQMAGGRWEGNSAPNPTTHTAMQVVTLAGRLGSGMKIKETFGLSFYVCIFLKEN